MRRIPKPSYATSFDQAVDAYERGRPGYPHAAIDLVLPPDARDVVDLGAGTGKLTRGLLGRGLEITAVEPLAGMREQLERSLPGVTVVAGTAEALPLSDASADAIVGGQMWHWVDRQKAVPEVHRVLRPGGVLGLLWNVRAIEPGWSQDLDDLLTSAQPAQEIPHHVGPPFEQVLRQDVVWTMAMTRARLLDMIGSRSYVILLPPAERADLLARVAAIVDGHPDLRGRQEFEYPFVTECSVFRRP